MCAPRKVFLITNIPTPYRIPLFNEINKQLEDRNIKLKVIFGALGYTRRKWLIDMSECKFEYQILPTRNIKYSDPEKSSFTYSGLYRLISKERPSVIISSGFSIATVKLWMRSWFKKTSYLIWSGAVRREDISDSFLNILQRRLLIKKATGFIAYGKKAKEYLVYLGADERKIEIGINTVDTQFYIMKTEMKKDKSRNGDEKKHLLCVSHLTQRKRIDQLFQIIKALSFKRKDFILEIVGDGIEKDNLKLLSEKLEITNYVKFNGFKQKVEMPNYFIKADCFLFPSAFDIWGLVLIEAMSAGLPCIASIYARACHDVIKEGITGFAMDFSKADEVAEKINWILDNPEKSKEIGQNARNFISKHVSLEKSAEGFVKAITDSLNYHV